MTARTIMLAAAACVLCGTAALASPTMNMKWQVKLKDVGGIPVLYPNEKKPDSIVVIDPHLVKRVGEGPQMIYRIPIISITKQTLGKMVYTSAVALGTFCGLMPQIVPPEALIRTIEENAPAGTVENNLIAFRAGMDAVKAARPESRMAIAAEQAGIEVRLRDTY